MRFFFSYLTRPNWLWAPPSHLFGGYCGSFPREWR